MVRDCCFFLLLKIGWMWAIYCMVVIDVFLPRGRRNKILDMSPSAP